MSARSTQFDAVFQARLAPASGPGRGQRRWLIWREQLACGHDACFCTDRRESCQERDCRWRKDCLDLRAEWKR